MTNPSKPIRVLNIVSTFCYNGGIESILLNILNPTTASAFTMTFAASPARKTPCAKRPGRWAWNSVLPEICRAESFSARFCDLLAGRRYDVVHSHVNSWAEPCQRGAAGGRARSRGAHPFRCGVLGGPQRRLNRGQLAAAFVDAVGLR